MSITEELIASLRAQIVLLERENERLRNLPLPNSQSTSNKISEALRPLAEIKEQRHVEYVTDFTESMRSTAPAVFDALLKLFPNSPESILVAKQNWMTAIDKLERFADAIRVLALVEAEEVLTSTSVDFSELNLKRFFQ